MENENGFTKLKLLYEENGSQFRFYLTWRQLLLAGYFAVIAALALGTKWALERPEPHLIFLFPLIGAGVSILFWALDYRNRELYGHSSAVGRAIEEVLGYKELGYYGAFPRVQKSKLRHGIILTVF